MDRVIKVHEATEQPRLIAVRRILRLIINLDWIVTVLVWPALRWIVAFDVALQAMRMLLRFSEVGIFLDWVFVIHFFGLTALLSFVSLYRPK